MRTSLAIFFIVISIAVGIAAGIAGTFRWLDKEAEKLRKAIPTH